MLHIYIYDISRLRVKELMEGPPSRSCASWNAVWSNNECREELQASAMKGNGTNDQSHFSAKMCM